MLTIAIAGLGTVGSGVVKLLRQNAELIAARAGQPVTIKAVSARDKKKKRDCDLSGIDWVDDPIELTHVPGVNIIVEAIGGASGPAHELAKAALGSGKHYITANKALLATHGVALARLAEKNKVQLSFEAAVAGGIPIIKTLREGLAGNRISAIRGIINGTCNYILTRMREAQLDFATALSEAQQKGYADIADPAFDIDGHDAACKLALLAALAYGVEPDLASVRTEGIRHITPLDLQFADELDCRIKLLGVAHMTDKGLSQRVGPSLISKDSPLAEVNGVLNAILLSGDFVGDLTIEGQGAGAAPTASAIVADIIDIACGQKAPAFGISADKLKKANFAKINTSRHYIRLQVMDKPGVVADVTAILRDEAISIESMAQHGKGSSGLVPVVLTTHESDIKAIARATDKVAHLPSVAEKPCVLQIED